MKQPAADEIPVAVSFRVLGLARQPYYRWLAGPVTDAELEEAYRANALFDAHREDRRARLPVPRLPSPPRWRDDVGPNGLADLFREPVVEHLRQERGSKNGRSGPPVHDELAGRILTEDALNQL